MRELVFSDALREIYATFGKTYPAQAVANAIFKRINELPDDFMAFALERCQQREDLPKNLGLFLRQQLWPDYRAAHPEVRQAQQACPDCDKDMPGFFTAWRNGVPVTCICACNTNSDWVGKILGPMSKRQAREQGLETSPPATDKASMALGHTESLRPAHKAQLEEMEVW